MSLLSRYLLRQNLFLMGSILLIGMGIYLLTDLFERLDSFLSAGLGIWDILGFFAVKSPTIIAQILPAVFLLALVVQMNILERNRELVALSAGGIAYAVIVRFVLVYALFWGAGQLFFAQAVGIAGEQKAARIWQEQVRGRSFNDTQLSRLWFTENNKIFHVETAYPVQQRGTGLTVYALDSTGIGIEEILKADSFRVAPGGLWILEEVERLIPGEYAMTTVSNVELAVSQDLRAFQISTGSGIRASYLTLPELSETIARLEQSGSNVENLRTTWHSKLSYAASILVMGLLALVVTRITPSIYKAVACTLLLVFFYYTLNTFFISLGERALVSPIVGGWFGTMVFFWGAALWLAWPVLRQRASVLFAR